MAILRARALALVHGSTHVLSGIDLDVECGDCLGITGSPGSGRRTLLRILATLRAPTSGTLHIDGIDALARVHQARRRLGFAGTPAGTAQPLRVREYLVFCHRARWGQRPDAGVIERALETAGLTPHILQETVPAGPHLALALAAALVCRPRVVFIDASADDRSIPATALTEMQRQGVAVVISLDEGSRLSGACQRLLRMRDGRLVGDPAGKATPPAAALGTVVHG